MTQFNIKNISPNLKEMTMTVFYEFSNGEVFSNTVSAETPVPEILAWGQEKCVWFDEREAQMEALRLELLEEPIIEE
jgi:hypothetical protein